MSDILIKHFSIPSNCMGCEWRDAEACGECELMIRNPFKTFDEQYEHCPFVVIAKRHSLVPVPPHGRLIDADAYSAEMKKRQDACAEWRDDIKSGGGYGTELYYRADSALSGFIEAKLTLDKVPTIIEAEEVL